jgi:Uma2 family endonuclease
MMDDLSVRTRPAANARMTFAEYVAFYSLRPDGERWELIDGEAQRVAPPSLIHQVIAKNIRDLLKKRLRKQQLDMRAIREVGVHVPEIDDYSPEPDVVIINSKVEFGQVWADRFYFAVEILSGEGDEVLDKKRAYYKAHAHCFGFMFVEQTEVRVELVLRGADGWSTQFATDPLRMIELPALGKIGRLRCFYDTTPLART